MNIKNIITLLIAILISNISFGQDSYEKFVQALISGDTLLAKKISDENTTTESIQTKLLPIKNIPRHVFNIRHDKLKGTIVALFNLDNQFENKILSEVFYNLISDNTISMPLTFQAETNKDTLFSKEYFSKPNTSDDIFLHDFHEVWLSKFYYSQNHPLEYTANFIIKLEKVNDSSTKVLIVADDAEVVNGTTGFGVHGPVARYTNVQGTTIEEYTLLEFIASKLGDKTLLPIRLPTDK